jgi:hypothetical protein
VRGSTRTVAEGQVVCKEIGFVPNFAAWHCKLFALAAHDGLLGFDENVARGLGRKGDALRHLCEPRRRLDFGLGGAAIEGGAFLLGGWGGGRVYPGRRQGSRTSPRLALGYDPYPAPGTGAVRLGRLRPEWQVGLLPYRNKASEAGQAFADCCVG